ncbi:MAG: redoxin domain-containing protein [Lachnospiraceae bacterium]|nr:redoxin domain-containing protein [Lachnospiraceae bacterium]
MIKKWICLACILCLAMSAAACSSSKQEPPAVSEAETSVSAEASEVPEPEESALPESEENAPPESAAPESEEAAVPGEEKAAEESVKISFETVDLEGKPVRSEEIFSENKITMVNLWGTYCGPCIREMPDLEVLRGRLEEKDCAVIGVILDVWDVNDSEMTGYADEIISQAGVTYRNLIPWDSIMEDLPCEFIPTTFFIDSEGHILGEAAVGARGADEYEALIDALLE